MREKLSAIVVETGPDPTACIVWLHGLGADGHDFEPLARELKLPGAIRYVFPHAPMRPVTINGGMRMRAWYDIVSPDLRRHVDAAGIRHSQELIQAVIEDQIAAGIDPGRIVLGGFSQGGVMALEAGARQEPPLAGVVALSAYLALPEEFPQASPHAPPILMAHGDQDPIVPLALAEQSRLILEHKGYRVSWRVFPMPHSVCAEEIAWLNRWLEARLY
ncbi:alpha/beta hydrolase [Methylothermus subterraneus]